MKHCCRPTARGLLVLAVCGLVAVPASERVAGRGTAPPAQVSSSEADVLKVLEQYSSALERLDAAAVKETQPSIDAANLERAFRDMEALEVDIEEVEFLSIDESTARVSCRVTQTLTPKAGSRQTTSVDRVLRLRKLTDSWVIDAFER